MPHSLGKKNFGLKIILTRHDICALMTPFTCHIQFGRRPLCPGADLDIGNCLEVLKRLALQRENHRDR